MKRFLLFIVIVGILALGVFLLLKTNATQLLLTLPKASPTPSLMPTAKTGFCMPKDLRATIVTQGAAGNIFGGLAIKNISSTQCIIQGNHFPTVTYTASNITIIKKVTPGPATIPLAPGQTVYSQMHFPNGAQCLGPTKQIPATFTYMISPTDTVTFVPGQNTPPITITTCATPTITTPVDVWSIHLQPQIQ